MPPIWRPVFSTSSHTGRFAGTKATHSPHDRVDSCPHKQYDFVGWAPRQLPLILTPIGCLMMSEHANQDGSQEGHTHEGRPLKQHSPQRGKIWGGREHAGMSLPLPPPLLGLQTRGFPSQSSSQEVPLPRALSSHHPLAILWHPRLMFPTFTTCSAPGSTAQHPSLL